MAIKSTTKQPKDHIKSPHPTEKTRLHPRNRHRERYDFDVLTKAHPDLLAMVSENRYGDASVDFSDPNAVMALNTAILKQYYDIAIWEIPANYLCPPIPGRADYIHNVADLLSEKNGGTIPKGEQVKCLDIGVGANCIYPIIGVKEYHWTFVGCEIDQRAIEAAKLNISSNPLLKEKVTIRHQPKIHKIFKNIIFEDDFFDVTVCNPPFHASAAEANESSQRKVKNLKISAEKPILNFGGQSNELWCEGGEEAFVQQMIAESKFFAKQCFWFTSLISKQSNLKRAYQALDRIGVEEFKTIPMGQGNKSSRLVAWTFLDPLEQKNWAKSRWQSPQCI